MKRTIKFLFGIIFRPSAFYGEKFDNYLKTKRPYFFLVSTLISIVGSIVLVFWIHAIIVGSLEGIWDIAVNLFLLSLIGLVYLVVMLIMFAFYLFSCHISFRAFGTDTNIKNILSILSFSYAPILIIFPVSVITGTKAIVPIMIAVLYSIVILAKASRIVYGMNWRHFMRLYLVAFIVFMAGLYTAGSIWILLTIFTYKQHISRHPYIKDQPFYGRIVHLFDFSG